MKNHSDISNKVRKNHSVIREHSEESFWHLKTFKGIPLISGEHPEDAFWRLKNVLKNHSDIRRPFRRIALIYRDLQKNRSAVRPESVKAVGTRWYVEVWNESGRSRQGISSSAGCREVSPISRLRVFALGLFIHKLTFSDQTRQEKPKAIYSKPRQ